ncbi:MAG: hypothetical protein JHC26_09900 [Thermofilum sp.]|jgi:hypothetical protein|uniref:hypothetical protein n=1 Tax=Thermofilum sp. TaxID=1961369 RepID=UPI0025887F0E|nr:hypothetical protein [Thermofilum sp.]MCI4409395.1 hypothetical protein [Thermofilum sp.]
MSSIANYLDEPEQIKNMIANILSNVKSQTYTIEPKQLFPYFNPRRREYVYFWLLKFPEINSNWVFVGYILSDRKNRRHVHRLVFARKEAVAWVINKFKDKLVLAKGVEAYVNA